MKNNFEKIKSENISNKLSHREVEKIAKKINDPRLKINEDIEHFVIHNNNNTIDFIAKRKIIPFKSADSIEYIKIEEYLQQYLKKLDSKKSKIT